MKLLSLLLLFNISLFAEYSTNIAIKKIKIGMTLNELKGAYSCINKKSYSKKSKKFTYNFGKKANFSIAGYKLLDSSLEFYDKKLVRASFTLKDENYALLEKSLKNKFPNIKCMKSFIQNFQGTKLNNLFCTVSDKTSILQYSRHHNISHNTSLIELFQIEELQDLKENSKAKIDDI